MKNKTKILEVDNIFSGYGETEILHGVSIEIYENEIVTIIGPNGCGKSTLMKTIFGLLRATSGNINFLIDDKLTSINNFDTENLIKQGLSYVPPIRQYLSFTIDRRKPGNGIIYKRRRNG